MPAAVRSLVTALVGAVELVAFDGASVVVGVEPVATAFVTEESGCELLVVELVAGVPLAVLVVPPAFDVDDEADDAELSDDDDEEDPCATTNVPAIENITSLIETEPSFPPSP